MEKKILEDAVSISRRQLSYFAPPSRLMEYSGRLSYPFSAAKPAVSRSPNGPADFIINIALGHSVWSIQKFSISYFSYTLSQKIVQVSKWEPLRVSNPRSRRLDVTTTEEIRGNTTANPPVYSWFVFSVYYQYVYVLIPFLILLWFEYFGFLFNRHMNC